MANINTLNRIKEISLALAGKINQTGRCRHFSFILKKNRILSIGFNQYKKTHPITRHFNFPEYQTGLHSEIAAILKYKLTDCTGLTIVNTRVNNNNEIDDAAPCKYCASTIKKLKFKKVIYSNKNGNWELNKN